jgi:hypothetical protein
MRPPLQMHNPSATPPATTPELGFCNLFHAPSFLCLEVSPVEISAFFAIPHRPMALRPTCVKRAGVTGSSHLKKGFGVEGWSADRCELFSGSWKVGEWFCSNYCGGWDNARQFATKRPAKELDHEKIGPVRTTALIGKRAISWNCCLPGGSITCSTWCRWNHTEPRRLRGVSKNLPRRRLSMARSSG